MVGFVLCFVGSLTLELKLAPCCHVRLVIALPCYLYKFAHGSAAPYSSMQCGGPASPPPTHPVQVASLSNILCGLQLLRLGRSREVQLLLTTSGKLVLAMLVLHRTLRSRTWTSYDKRLWASNR